jgi:hypothetical protein
VPAEVSAAAVLAEVSAKVLAVKVSAKVSAKMMAAGMMVAAKVLAVKVSAKMMVASMRLASMRLGLASVGVGLGMTKGTGNRPVPRASSLRFFPSRRNDVLSEDITEGCNILFVATMPSEII